MRGACNSMFNDRTAKKLRYLLLNGQTCTEPKPREHAKPILFAPQHLAAKSHLRDVHTCSHNHSTNILFVTLFLK